MSDDLTVAQLLQQSRAENLSRIRCGNAKPPNYPQAEAHAAKALELRQLAHATDPEHTDREWKNDKAKHADVVAFLTAYPSIP